MGSSASTNKTTARPELKSIFDTMHLSKQEISKLYEIFKSIDKEKTGRIRARELLNFLDIDTSLFAERIFSPFEKNSTEDNQSIDFFGFVLSLWRFCSLGKESVAEFVFDLYDTDNDGVLTEEEAKVMFNDLHFYGREIVEDEESKTLRVELLETKNGEITPAHFHVFFTDHKMLVLPLFLVQKRLRDAFLGQKFWKDMSERSVILSPKGKVSLADIMVAEEDRVIFHQLLHDNSTNSLRQLMKQAVETELLTVTKPIDIHNNYGTTTDATTIPGTSSSNMILEESNSLKQMKKELLQHVSIKDAGRVG